MTLTFDWKPEPTLLEKVITLAHQRGQSPEAIVTEAVRLYLETVTVAGDIGDIDSDPLVGLFAGSSDLATESENILQKEVTEKSGWTWKENL